MSVMNLSQDGPSGLPDALMAAQAAMRLPEVQEMLCRLSKFNLGIFMPHMHDEDTGAFQSLPEDIMQVESGLEVSFKPMKEISKQTKVYLPVGWCWRPTGAAPVIACEMVWAEGSGGAEGYIKHTMLADK